MFTQMKTNFEQSLRARIFPVTPKLNGNNPGLNPEFHRGCTGKAHACGTVKSRLLQQANNKAGKTTGSGTAARSANSSVNGNGKKPVQRKNSISSETISDSGSENSAPSWLDTTDCVANNNEHVHGKVENCSSSNNCLGNGKTPEAKKCKLETKKRNLAENVSIIRSGSGKLMPGSCNMVRKSPTPTNADRRRRLYSEGDRMSETGASNTSTNSINVTQQKQHTHKAKLQESTFERIQKYRSFRVGNNSLRKSMNTSTSIPTSNRPTTTSANNNNIRPPWNSGSALKVTVTSASPTFNTRNYRNSFRRRDVVDWTAIWERSFALRGYAGNSGMYKNYNEAIKRKVCKLIINKYY